MQLVDTTSDEEAAPRPESQEVALHGEIEEKAPPMKPTLLGGDDGPSPDAHFIASSFERDIKRKLEVIDDESVPYQSNHDSASELYGDDATRRDKSAVLPPTSDASGQRETGSMASPSLPSTHGHNAGRIPQEPPSVSSYEGENMRDSRGHETRRIPQEPPSPPPHQEASTRETEVVVEEAQLVQSVGATLIENDNFEVFNAVPLKPWWRRRQTFILGGISLLIGIGVAVPIVLTVGPEDGTLVIEESVIFATNQPSMSSMPSSSPSMFPTFQLGALDIVDEVLSNVTILFADGEVSKLGVTVKFEDVGCQDLGVQDIQFFHHIENATLQRVRMNTTGVQMLCGFEWSAKWLFLKISGSVEGVVEPTSSMETDVNVVSEDFNKYPPHDIYFDNCKTDFDIDVDISDDGSNLIGGILETLYDIFVDNALEKQMKKYFCEVLQDMDNETGVFDDLLTVFSEQIDAVLSDVSMTGADSLWMEEMSNTMIPGDEGVYWVNFLDLKQNTQEAIELESGLNHLIEFVLDSSSERSPELEEKNRGEFDSTLSLNYRHQNSTFLKFFGISVSVSTISVNWPGSTKELKEYAPIGDFTLQSGLYFENLPVTAALRLTMQPDNTGLYFEETFVVEVNVTDVHADFALFLGMNRQINENGTLGPIFYQQNGHPCFSSTIDEVKFTLSDVNISDITTPEMSGFLDPGLYDLVSTGGEALFHMYEQSLTKVLPGYLGSTLQQMLDDFGKDAFNVTACPMPDSLYGDEVSQAPPPDDTSGATQRIVLGSIALIVAMFSTLIV
jgi:hypothetical protein